MPPSIEHLEKRLQSRETETPESIKRRIGKAENELQAAIMFDKIVLNDTLEHALVEAEKIVSDFLN